MLFKYFTDKDNNQSVSINPNRVKCVRETSFGPKIIFEDGTFILVDGSFLDVTTRLSEN